MDLSTAARIKANARLQPAKEIGVLYSDLLANTNPEKFAEIRDRLLLATDAAAAEYYIFERQVIVITDLIQDWDGEIQLCEMDSQTLKTEINALDQEREPIEARVRSLSHLEALKERIMAANVEGLRNDHARILTEHANTEKDIESIEFTNEKISVALRDVIAGFERFLLKDKPSGGTTEMDSSLN
jgi:chromosome segregation ATPase